MSDFPEGTAAASGLAAYHDCGRVSRVELERCPRCGSALHLRTRDSIQRTIALMIAASILYVPANVYPIMTTDQLGVPLDSTILGGVILLWEMGSYPVALVIFVASVLVPLGKLVGLGVLVFAVVHGRSPRAREHTVLYRVTEFVGRWSMVDVFVVAILVGLIQLGGLLAIRPGVAALAFGAVVVLTMLAAESFDPRLLWDRQHRVHGLPSPEADRSIA